MKRFFMIIWSKKSFWKNLMGGKALHSSQYTNKKYFEKIFQQIHNFIDFKILNINKYKLVHKSINLYFVEKLANSYMFKKFLRYFSSVFYSGTTFYWQSTTFNQFFLSRKKKKICIILRTRDNTVENIKKNFRDDKEVE